MIDLWPEQGDAKSVAQKISRGGLTLFEYIAAIAVYFCHREWDLARGATERALEEYPKSAELLALHGDISAAMGNWDQADERWQKAMALADVPSVLVTRRVWGSLRRDDPGAAQTLLREGRRLGLELQQLALAEAAGSACLREWAAVHNLLQDVDPGPMDPVWRHLMLLLHLALESPERSLQLHLDSWAVVRVWCPEARAQAVCAFYQALSDGVMVSAEVSCELREFPVVALRFANSATDEANKRTVLAEAAKANPGHVKVLEELTKWDPDSPLIRQGLTLLGERATTTLATHINTLAGSLLSESFVKDQCARKEARALELIALGGAEQVGASAYVLKKGGKAILLDCGLDPKHRGPAAYPDFDKHLLDIHAVVISHGHLDHCGALAKVHETWPSAKVYCTDPTIRYARLLLQDMLKIQGNHRGREVYADRLPQASVEDALSSIESIPFGQWVSLFDGCRVRLHPAGHILGASMVEIDWDGLCVVYTGDYCLHDQGLVKGAGLPAIDADCDLLLCEATYAAGYDLVRTSWAKQMDMLVKATEDVLQRGGSVLLPSFAIGRSQELVFKLRSLALQGKLPTGTSLWLAGMAADACGFAEEAWKHAGNGSLLHLTAPPVCRPDWDAIPQPGTVIIASSGMLVKGSASAHYAKLLQQDPANAIFMPGHYDEESEIFREIRLERATVAYYNLSAHSGPEDLLQVAIGLKPRAVALVHWGDGGRIRRHKFAEQLRHRLGGDCMVSIPKRGDTIRPCDPADWLNRKDCNGN